jgi:surfeit locus 1 family protein
MMTSEARTGAAVRQGFPVVMTLFAAAAFAILIGLGVWQVQRLHWKEGVLARIAALQAAPPQSIFEVLSRARAGGDIDYTRVSADCPHIESTPFVRLFAPGDGGGGFRIITHCVLTGGPYHSILVDRGFIDQDQVAKMDASKTPLDRAIVGVLRKGDARNFLTPDNQPGQGLFYSRDIAVMAHVLGAVDPAPTFLMLESPAPADVGPKPAPVPVDIPNNHLSYAITWFGLAASLAGVYLASLWRRRAR